MIQTFILALVQGFTEFLPVSSSGHLILIPHLLGWKDQGLEMDVALHVGTLLAVLVYFWRDLWAMCMSFIKFRWDGPMRLAFALIVGTLPVVVVGFIFKQISTIRTPLIIALMSMTFGIVLYLADRWGSQKKQLEDFSLKNGLMVGFAQTISLIPGVSRSGVCMTAARALGFDRLSSARFAFLLSIPAILGAATLTFFDALKQDIPLDAKQFLWGGVWSFVFGFLAIHGMLKLVKNHSFLPFMIYRLLLGFLILILI